MRKLVVLSALALTALLTTIGPATAASSKVDTDGFGTYVVDGNGTAALTGTATGAPFDGTYTATLAAADGTLPDPGVCEPATATMRLDGTRGRYLELTSTDEVCGQWLQPPYVVTHVFTGRYTVTASSSRRLTGTDGFFEVRLATEGRAGVFAIDT